MIACEDRGVLDRTGAVLIGTGVTLFCDMLAAIVGRVDADTLPFAPTVDHTPPEEAGAGYNRYERYIL